MSLNEVLFAAAEAQKGGRFDEAEHFCRKAFELSPENAAAKYILGTLLARQGRTAEASNLLEDVRKLEPSYEVLHSLSTLYLDQGEAAKALDPARSAVLLQPNRAQAHNLLGRCFLMDRDLEGAEIAFLKAIELDPSLSAAYYNLGKAKQLSGREHEAIELFEIAVNLLPNASNLLALGQVLLGCHEFERAEACARQCLVLNPQSTAGHLLLCGILIQQEKLEEANVILQMAISMDKDGKHALQIAERQKQLGHIEEASQSLRRAIDLDPGQISAYHELVYNRKITTADLPLLESMQKLAGKKNLSPTEHISLEYALGKACENLGRFEQSMRHYDEANRATKENKVGSALIDREKYSAYIDALIDNFTPGIHKTGDKLFDLPILIVGMMRSGTTLAEQILSCHPKIGAGGEQLYWTLHWQTALGLENDKLRALGDEYRSALQSLAPGFERVTDKMPGNYHFAGLIHLAMPNARIIHMRRSPVDTCLSIWATPNKFPSEGGHHKGDLVFVYKEYLRLMAHWRRVLPSDRFLEMDYEDLVSNREQKIPELVEFCGVEWNDACLRPELNNRPVSTPSLWQVRQPLYRSSVDRWRNFEPWLGEFTELER
ncbi:MAG TPA: sulfotransferase [Fimbriimonadaceae bacterium]|jgi:tetratricopeptide (TPR) repeat protein